MRVNVYAEEMTDRIEIVQKSTEAGDFTGVRFYLELPVTIPVDSSDPARGHTRFQGPFLHKHGDDDSAAVTFWGKQDLRAVLRKALTILDDFYEARATRLEER